MTDETVSGTGTEQETEQGTEQTTITLDELKNQFNLRGKNAGCTLECRGKIVMVAFLINDGESKWDASAEAEMVEVLKSASENLMNASGLNKKDLQIAYAYRQVNVPYAVTRATMDQCVTDVIRQFGYKTVADYQKHYETKFARDEAVISFVFNKNFRSFARKVHNSNKDFTQASPAGEEFSMVAFRRGEPYGNEKTFVHEMMHQFGAIDLYYPDYLKFKAEKMLPESIMNNGKVIDPLTRYLIGWDEEPSQEALAFLKAIENLTEDDIQYALEEQRKHDW